MRQSIIMGHMYHLSELEHEMQSLLGLQNSKLFSFNRRAQGWFADYYSYATTPFFLTFSLLVAAAPSIVLFSEPYGEIYAWIYLVIAVALLAVYALSYYKVVTPERSLRPHAIGKEGNYGG
jgi:hypothetical protein